MLGEVGIDGHRKISSPRAQSPVQPPAEQGFTEPLPSVRKRMRMPMRSTADAFAASIPSTNSPRNSVEQHTASAAGRLAEGGRTTTKSGHTMYVHEVLRDFFQKRPHTTLIDVFRNYDADKSGNIDVRRALLLPAQPLNSSSAHPAFSSLCVRSCVRSCVLNFSKTFALSFSQVWLKP